MENKRVKDLQISFEEGFRQLSEEEMKQARFINEGDEGVVMRDDEKHMVVSAAYKKVSGIALAFLKEEEIVENTQKQFEKMMQPFDYHLDEYVTKQGQMTLHGFEYTYLAQGTGMRGASFVIKDKKGLYYLHFYMREALKEESHQIMDAILESVDLVQEG